MRFLKFISTIAAFMGISALCGEAMASVAVVEESPWGASQSYLNSMAKVFGLHGYDAFGSYASVNVGSLFSSSYTFIFLEGGASSDLNLLSFLNQNSVNILNWVSAGGGLLVESAGWYKNISFAGVTLEAVPAHPNWSATLTTAGLGLISGSFPLSATQTGTYVSHDAVIGNGLTTYMTGDDTGDAVVAGKAYGKGYIMFSGLTAPEFQQNAGGQETALLANIINATVNSTALTVPGPVAGTGLIPALGLGAFAFRHIRRRQQKAA